MHIEVQTKALITAIKQVSKLMDKKPRLVSLSHILLTNTEKGLTVFASNITNDIEITIPSTHISDVTIALEAKPLLKVLSTFPKKSTVTITDLGEITDRQSIFTLKTLDPDDMPPKVSNDLSKPALYLCSNQIHTLINTIKDSMAIADIRYFLNGALLDIKPDEITLVATDGHKLSMINMEYQQPHIKTKVIIPRLAITMLSDLTKGNELDWDIHITDNVITFTTDGITLSSNLIQGTFPPYEAVIPKFNDHSVIIDRQTFISALMRLQAIMTKFNNITLDLNGDGLNLEYRILEEGKTESTITTQTVPVTRNDTTYHIKTGFNCGYLLSVLNTMSSKDVTMSYSEPSTAFVFTEDLPSKPTHVIMPMRL